MPFSLDDYLIEFYKLAKPVETAQRRSLRLL